MKELDTLVEKWKYRQSCNNQPEQNDIAKAKAHIYGICAEELKTVIARMKAEQREKEVTDMY